MRGMNFELSLWSQLRYMNLYIHTRLYIKVYKLKRKTNGAPPAHDDDRHRLEGDAQPRPGAYPSAARPRDGRALAVLLRGRLHGGEVSELEPVRLAHGVPLHPLPGQALD